VLLYLATLGRTSSGSSSKDTRRSESGPLLDPTTGVSTTLDRLATYQTVIREELETPLHPATINELRWYFTQRQTAIG